MDAQKVDMYLLSNAKFFPTDQVMMLREKLLAVVDNQWETILAFPLKDPTTSLIVSILAGSLGIDRFMVGDIGLGLGKLLTFGGLGIWTMIDWFFIQEATREKNLASIYSLLS